MESVIQVFEQPKAHLGIAELQRCTTNATNSPNAGCAVDERDAFA